jgi:hypothetical protein
MCQRCLVSASLAEVTRRQAPSSKPYLQTSQYKPRTKEVPTHSTVCMSPLMGRPGEIQIHSSILSMLHVPHCYHGVDIFTLDLPDDVRRTLAYNRETYIST